MVISKFSWLPFSKENFISNNIDDNNNILILYYYIDNIEDIINVMNQLTLEAVISKSGCDSDSMMHNSGTRIEGQQLNNGVHLAGRGTVFDLLSRMRYKKTESL